MKYLILLLLGITIPTFACEELQQKDIKPCDKCLHNYAMCLRQPIDDFDGEDLVKPQAICRDKLNSCAKINKCK